MERYILANLERVFGGKIDDKYTLCNHNNSSCNNKCNMDFNRYIDR